MIRPVYTSKCIEVDATLLSVLIAGSCRADQPQLSSHLARCRTLAPGSLGAQVDAMATCNVHRPCACLAESYAVYPASLQGNNPSCGGRGKRASLEGAFISLVRKRRELTQWNNTCTRLAL